MDHGFKREDYGMCFVGQYRKEPIPWSKVPLKMLEFLVKDECQTPEYKKEIARKELAQRKLCEGQLGLFDNG